MNNKLKNVLIAALLIFVIVIIVIANSVRNQNKELNDLENQIIQKDSVIKKMNIRVIERTKEHRTTQKDYQNKIDSMLNELNINIK